MLLLCLVHGLTAYHDPATHLSSASYAHKCSTNSNNGAHAGEMVATPDMESSLNMVSWARDYSAAFDPTRRNEVLRLLLELSSRPSYSLKEDRHQKFFDFVNLKMHVLDALENRAPLRSLWRPGMRLLDVGCGHGFLDAYLQARHGVQIKGYDIANSYQCKEMMVSPLKVHFFDGRTIPEGAASFEAVLFMSVLHHAANNTFSLLQSASQVAKEWIVVLEDLQTANRAIQFRNRKHDPTGIFRTDEEWKAMFRGACEGFELLGDGYLGERISQRMSNKQAVYTHIAGNERRHFQKWYVLKRSSRAR